MCGLVGLLTQAKNGPWKDEWDAFNSLMVVNNLRGAHSTGVGAVYNDGSLQYLKEVGTAWDLWLTKDWDDFAKKLYGKGRFLMGHGRYATKGEVNVENAHPFMVKEKDGHNLLLVHNGTLESYQKLPDFSKYPVDSLWMCHMIAEYGVEEVFEKINGAIATMWFDQKDNKVHFYRNYQRPLFRLRTKQGSYLFNSEAANLAWINQRHGLNAAPEDLIQLEPYVLYSVDLETLEWQEKKIEKKYETVTYGGSYTVPARFRDMYQDDDTPFARGGSQTSTTTSTPPKGRVIQLINVKNSEYAPLRSNLKLRQIYLDTFSGKYDEVVFDERGAVCQHASSNTQSLFPGIMAPKFAVSKIKHFAMNEIVETSHMEGIGQVLENITWDEIFEEITPFNHKTSEGDKRPLVGRKFRPNRRVRFSIPIKGANKETTNIKNYAWTEQDNKYHLSVYGNEVDGAFYKGGLVCFEPFEALDISNGFVGSPKIHKVLGSLIDAKTNSLITVEWYPSNYASREEIFAEGVFVGEIQRMMISTKEEHKKFKDVVRILVGSCVPLDKVTNDISDRYNKDSQYSFEELVNKSNVSSEEEIDGNE